jgi:hypothetical protein
MLVKFLEEKENIYMCSSSDWTVITKSKNENLAASKAVKYLIDNWGLDINLAPSIIVKKIKEKLENPDYVIRMDKALSDIGMYKESKALKEIFEDDRD